jgi:hypothetical protein
VISTHLFFRRALMSVAKNYLTAENAEGSKLSASRSGKAIAGRDIAVRMSLPRLFKPALNAGDLSTQYRQVVSNFPVTRESLVSAFFAVKFI